MATRYAWSVDRRYRTRRRVLLGWVMAPVRVLMWGLLAVCLIPASAAAWALDTMDDLSRRNHP